MYLTWRGADGTDVGHRLGGQRDRRLSAYRSVPANTKNQTYLRENQLRFGEDLSAEDKETRAAVWPAVDTAAGKNGKKAYFVGRKAFVDRRDGERLSKR